MGNEQILSGRHVQETSRLCLNRCQVRLTEGAEDAACDLDVSGEVVVRDLDAGVEGYIAVPYYHRERRSLRSEM